MKYEVIMSHPFQSYGSTTPYRVRVLSFQGAGIDDGTGFNRFLNYWSDMMSTQYGENTFASARMSCNHPFVKYLSRWWVCRCHGATPAELELWLIIDPRLDRFREFI